MTDFFDDSFLTSWLTRDDFSITMTENYGEKVLSYSAEKELGHTLITLR